MSWRQASASAETTPQSDSPPKRVALFVDHFAHYREPAFRAIGSTAGIALTVFSDTRSSVPALRVFSEGDIRSRNWPFEWRRSRHFSLGLRTLWETGIVRQVFSRDYDIIVGWGGVHKASSWAALIAGWVTGKPVVLWTHGLYGKEGWLLNRLRVLYYGLASSLLLYGNAARSRLIRCGVDPKRLHVIYNALDLAKQEMILDSVLRDRADAPTVAWSLAPTPDTRLIGYIGRITPAKRVDLLVDAVALLRSRGLDFRLVLIGDGPSRPEIVRQANDAGIAGLVRMTGALYDEEQICRLVSTWDICVFPESVGLGAIHALAFGTPVVTHSDARTQKPEAEIIRPGFNGAVFRRGDVEDLARRVLEWIEANPDRENVRTRCRSLVQRYYNPRFQAMVFERAIAGDPPLAECLADPPKWFLEEGPNAARQEER